MKQEQLILNLHTSDLMGIKWGNGECFVLRHRSLIQDIKEKIVDVKEFIRLSDKFDTPSLINYSDLDDNARQFVDKALEKYIDKTT